MKQILTIVIMLMSVLTGMAQSSDLYYPMGAWQTPYDGENEGSDYVLFYIHRHTERNPEHPNTIACGELVYDEYGASLVYLGRQIDSRGFATDVFMFQAVDDQGRTTTLGIRKIMGEDGPSAIECVSVNGYLAGKPGLKKRLSPSMYANGSHWYDFTFQQPTYPLFLQHIREVAQTEDKMRRSGDVEYLPLIRGFGDLHQFVNAHKGLTYGQPVYAKSKTAVPVSIRRGSDASEATIGVLKQGTTLYVVDEYNGWCQVTMENSAMGWVRLSDVILTNTPPEVIVGDRSRKKWPDPDPDDKKKPEQKPAFTLTKVDDIPGNPSSDNPTKDATTKMSSQTSTFTISPTTTTTTTPSQPVQQPVQQPAVQQPAEANRKVRGDLGIFELYGPVKSFTFTNEWGTVKRTFDRNGIWLTIDGQTLKTIYNKGIKRDKNGRLVKGIMDADGNGEDYKYDAEGRVTRRFYHFYDTIEEDTYTYDATGKLLKMHVEEGGMDAAEPYTEVYEILSTDSHGNWTKRRVKTGSQQSVHTRVISYY